MKKSILVILLVLLAFSLWSVLAIAKDKVAQKPTQVQKTEPNVAPEAFPKVMLPQAQPVRPTKEDFKREVLDRKGRTTEMMKNMQGQSVPAVNQEAAEKEEMPTLCTVANALAGGYYHSGGSGNPYLYCWGDVVIATLNNPEDSAYNIARCPYPNYPFMAKQVLMAMYSITDTATVLFQPEIREALYDADGCAYPGAALLTGPVYNLALGAGGVNQTYLSLVDSVCLYKPWFAVMHFLNTDDFIDTTYCAPINTSAILSELFDNSGRTCQSYWNPYGPGGSWYDVTLYGISNGAIRVRTRGYSRPENTCPIPPDPWYFKDSLALAPCGVPDFDQAQFPPAFCGPVAEANSYWWLNAKWGFDPAPMNPVALVNEIAAAAGTDPVTGTNCDQLEAAILQVIKAHGGWWFTETTVYKPVFWDLQKELKACEDVTLLLGFWQFDGANWIRFGGHFVTMAGVDIYNYKFAFSDPAIDNAEAHFPNPVFGAVCHTDPFPHVGNPIVHNNPANTSHDYYDVAWPSPSPGGYLWLPYYEVNWPAFNGQNAGPLPNTGTYNPLLPVQVEIEQAIAVSPGPFKMYGTVHSSRAYETEDNRGSIDSFGKDFDGDGKMLNGLYDGSLIVATNQADLNMDMYGWLPTFVPLGPPVCDSFFVAGAAGIYKIEQCTYVFAHSILPLKITKYAFGFWVPQGGTQECEQVIEDVFVIENIGATTIHCIEKAVWLDFDLPPGYMDLSYGSQPFQSKWMWNPGAPDSVYGLTKMPIGTRAISGWGLSQAARVYDKQYVDSLKYWMENGWTPAGDRWGDDNDFVAMDRSIIIVDSCFDLAPGEMHINKWLKWGFKGLLYPQDTLIYPAQYDKWRIFLYNVLHQEGFYRGDVNQDGKNNVADVIYMINYLFKGGPKPIEFVDQGDVNCDDLVNVADVIYDINYLFKGGPAKIDKNRFLRASPFVDPAHKPLGIRRTGLFGDPVWKGLHP